MRPGAGSIAWYKWELQYSLLKKYREGPLFTIFFYINTIKKLLDENYVEFDFRIGHVLIIFPFLWILNGKLIYKGKGEVFYGQEPPSAESTTTECEVNYIYQLLAVMLLKQLRIMALETVDQIDLPLPPTLHMQGSTPVLHVLHGVNAGYKSQYYLLQPDHANTHP